MREEPIRDGDFNESLVYLEALLKDLTEKVDAHAGNVSRFEKSVCSLKGKGPGSAEAKRGDGATDPQT